MYCSTRSRAVTRARSSSSSTYIHSAIPGVSPSFPSPSTSPIIHGPLCYYISKTEENPIKGFLDSLIHELPSIHWLQSIINT